LSYKKLKLKLTDRVSGPRPSSRAGRFS
jgi:hypothetical protein